MQYSLYQKELEDAFGIYGSRYSQVWNDTLIYGTIRIKNWLCIFDFKVEI